MEKYPHGLTLSAVCEAIDAYQRHEDDVPESGILAAFNILLGKSDIAEAILALEGRAETAEAEVKRLNATAPAVPDGWKLVPVEPSWEMISAAIKSHEGDAFLPVSLYKTMLAAAPEVE